MTILNLLIIIIIILITIMLTNSFYISSSCILKKRMKSSLIHYLTTNIFIVGKKNGGEDFINEGCMEYEKRLKPTMQITTHFLKSDGALIDAVANSKGTVIALDENGRQYTSREFSKEVYKGLEDGGAHLNFCIGGFDGLPDEIKKTARLISLSKMTWTHQMARLLLLEQIYRAVEIRKGTAYHKD
jgi:23S rRNA (pseudouridine1915-N3)-methyltransferase